MSTLRPMVPSSRAVYLHTLKSCSGAFLGEILSVAFMPNGDPVVLTSTGKKVGNANTVQGSAFFRLFSLSGFLELNWAILEISANLMRKSYDPPPHRHLFPLLVVPTASEYVVLK